MHYRLILSSFLLFINVLVAGSRTVNPLDYGLLDAKTGEERFWVLYNAHVDAVEKNLAVSYSGIHSLSIEIPSNAKSIPLTNNTDFKGLVLNVKNTQKKDFVLFLRENEPQDIEVEKRCFNDLNFSVYNELDKGAVLLVVHDEVPWVRNRIGYNYGVTRYDVLLLKNGHSENRPISTYYNDYSLPRCQFVQVSNKRKVFKNIVFRRDVESSMKTYLLRVNFENNYEIKNIGIITPRNEELNGDHAISLNNCTNVFLKGIKVDNTYSSTTQFGYAFSLFNVWNSRVKYVEATADWGVFCGDNVNYATVSNCNINRFDLHCYGRDFFLKNCTITSGVPIGCFYGTLSFKKCLFKQGQPCIYRDGYNSYLPFSLEFEKCVIEMNKKRQSLLYISQLFREQNSREELKIKNLPNISIKDCKILCKDGLTSFDIVSIKKNEYPFPLGGINSIIIDGLTVEGLCKEMRLVTNQTVTDSRVRVVIDGISFEDNAEPRIVVNFKDLQGNIAEVKINNKLDNIIVVDN